MFSHVTLGSNDVERAKTFYDAALGALGVAPGALLGDRVIYRTDTGVLIVTKPINGQTASAGNGETIGFACASPAQADAWHADEIERAAGGLLMSKRPFEWSDPSSLQKRLS